jgi:hypothetical protein
VLSISGVPPVKALSLAVRNTSYWPDAPAGCAAVTFVVTHRQRPMIPAPTCALPVPAAISSVVPPEIVSVRLTSSVEMYSWKASRSASGSR